MPESQTTTQVQTQDVRFSIVIEPELAHVWLSGGYSHMRVLVAVKAILETDDRRYVFATEKVEKAIYLFSDPAELDKVVELVEKAKERVMRQIDEFISLRQKALTVLRQFGEVKEYL